MRRGRAQEQVRRARQARHVGSNSILITRSQPAHAWVQPGVVHVQGSAAPRLAHLIMLILCLKVLAASCGSADLA